MNIHKTYTTLILSATLLLSGNHAYTMNQDFDTPKIEETNEKETSETFVLAGYITNGELDTNVCLEEHVSNNLRELVMAMENPFLGRPKSMLLHKIAPGESRTQTWPETNTNYYSYQKTWADRASHTPQNARERLFAAALESHHDGIDLALQDGADINTTVDQYGETILHHIAHGGNLETAQFLIARKANVNRSNHNGETPLHKAIKGKNKFSMTELLLQAKANPDLRDDAGFSVRNIALGCDICAGNNVFMTLINSMAKEEGNPEETGEESIDQYD